MSFALPQRSVLATPLAALELVVLDTETTGLDVARDAVIELAGVRVRDGQVLEEDSFSSLVNPQRAISRQSMKIHGISDADVADAPPFAEVMHAFARWAGAQPIAGYMVGFDLAILRAEHHRHGLRWQVPLALDVQALAAAVAPRLPELSLEAIAAWLEVDTGQRHRALADALSAAHILVRLVPLLKERGIITLAQALKACGERRQAPVASAPGLPAEWQLEPPPQWQAGRAVESYPFRHRVRDVMSRDPAIIEADATLDEALQRMLQRHISSLFVPPEDSDGDPLQASPEKWGIITERDILRAIAADGPGVLRQPVVRHASFPLITVAEHEFLYRALARMQARGLRHLGVRSRREEKLVGALSQRDLLRYRASESLVLVERLRQATSAEELAALWPMLMDVARAMMADHAPANDIAAVIAREVRALTSRACQLAAEEMEQAGRGGPPVRWGLLVLGSAGRGESLLAMDQDNAIVFEQPQDADEGERQALDAWFAEFGARVNAMLDTAGVPLCKGGVMARNERWRGSERTWLERVRSWLSHAGPEDLLHVDIFFDLRRACGERQLTRRFRQQVLQMAQEAHTLHKFLALQAADFETPLGWFGRIRSDEQGRVDLKKSGLLPIASAARVLALKLGSTARATPARLKAAADAGICPAALAENMIQAHRVFLGAILRQQMADIEAGLAPSNRVALKELDAHAREELRWALEQVGNITGLLGVPDMRMA